MPGAAPTPKEMPLVGRTEILVQILDKLLDDSGEPASFLLAGSAGVGKSRLATEVAKAAGAADRVTAKVVATRAAASIPFGAFAPLMPDIVTPPSGLLTVLRTAGEAIVERAGAGARLLLLVDDAHLLDDGSSALLHQLVLDRACSVLATVRIPGAVPDPITTLWKDGLAERLDLEALGPEETEDLVASTLGGPLTGAARSYFYEVTQGNPLYIRELLIGAVDSGALRRNHGLWTLRRPFPAPGRLVELVAARLGDLPSGTARVIDLLALGEPLELELLMRMAGEEAVADAERRGLAVAHDREGRADVALAHPLYGEVCRQGLPRARLRQLSGELAAAVLAAGARRKDDELRVARWTVDGGMKGDPELLGRAALLARYRFDLELASRLAHASLEAGGGVEAGLALAEADFFSGQTEQAEAVLAQLAAVCRTDEEISRVANARAYNLGIMLGDREAARNVIEAALAVVSEPIARYRLLDRRSTEDVFAGRTREALADALELYESGDEGLVNKGVYVASIAYAWLGQCEDSLRISRAGIAADDASAADGPERKGAYMVGPIFALIGAGRLDEAESEAVRGYEGGVALNSQALMAPFATLRGLLYVERGTLGDASRMFREAAALNRDMRDMASLRWCLGGFVLAEAMAGNRDAAARGVEELAAVPPHWSDSFDPDLVERGRAWERAVSGEVAVAIDILRSAADLARHREYRMTEARLLHDVARLGEPGSVTRRLSELAASTEGELVKVFAKHAGALEGREAVAIEEAADAFESLGAYGLAAEASKSAASVYQSLGLARAASARLRKADSLSARGGTASTGPGPGAEPTGEAPKLTRREREIAGLAAAGMTSKEIGERLFISARTVDNHLLHAYSKLGVTNRDELATALAPV